MIVIKTEIAMYMFTKIITFLYGCKMTKTQNSLYYITKKKKINTYLDKIIL